MSKAPRTTARTPGGRGAPHEHQPARLLAAVNSPSAANRFDAARKLVHLGRVSPGTVYPHFDDFVRLLGSGNQILRWNAIFALANLAAVDAENKWDTLIDSFLASVGGPVLITAANTSKSAPAIARARPQYAAMIEASLLGVTRAHYQTPECRNIALGHAIRALDQMWDLLPDTVSALGFARRQLRNSRNATRRAAEALVQRRGTAAVRPAERR